ncbi:MAG: phosphoribosyltransferase [Hyphomicrobiales bacterium]
MAFTDRTEAGRRLGAALAGYRGREAVVLALPRGGVPVAAEIAEALDAPLDLVMVRKIGAPGQPELAMGAVVDGPDPLVVRNEEVIRGLDVDETAFTEACRRELAEIERRRQDLLGTRHPAEVSERTAIVVDDGIATGATTRAALRAVRKRGPAWLVLAVPVAPTSTLAELAGEADDIVCLEDYEPFGAIGMFYSDFRQLSDRDVIDILARFSPAE